MVWKFFFTNIDLLTSAGTSPTIWTRGLATLGLAGTRGLASPTEELPSFIITNKASIGESSEVGLGLESPGRTQGLASPN